MRFDVTNVNAGFDLTVNAIRFTITTNASSAAFDKTFKLYKSTDLNTVVGQGVSAVLSGAATSSAVTGYVTMYPWSGNVVASGGSATYILKMDTSSMNSVSGPTNDQLGLAIADGDFYFSDGLVTTANQKVLNLPVTGNQITY
jgi:hypothetical protein